MNRIWLLTTGDGQDGNEWYVVGIFSTEELANRAALKYRLPDDKGFSKSCNDPEEWIIDPPGLL